MIVRWPVALIGLLSAAAWASESALPHDLRGDARWFVDKSWRIAVVVDDYDHGGNTGKADHLFLFCLAGPAAGVKAGAIKDATIVFGDDRVLRIEAKDGSASLTMSFAPAPTIAVGATPPPGIYGGVELAYYPLGGNEPLATVTTGTQGSGSQTGWKPKPEDLADGVSTLPGTLACGVAGPIRESGCSVECASGYHGACSANPRYGQRRCVCLKD